jgi:hypothetical protein
LTRELLEQRRWERVAALLERYCGDPLIFEGATVLPREFGGGLLIINSALRCAWHFQAFGVNSEQVGCLVSEPDSTMIFTYNENVCAFNTPLEELVRNIARWVGLF